MRGAEVLAVARYPKAVLEITEAAPADKQAPGAAGRYIIGGQFTLHGVKRPVRFMTELVAANQPGVMLLRGWFTIQQTQFGITPYSVVGGAIGIEDELTIYGEIYLRSPGNERLWARRTSSMHDRRAELNSHQQTQTFSPAWLRNSCLMASASSSVFGVTPMTIPPSRSASS